MKKIIIFSNLIFSHGRNYYLLETIRAFKIYLFLYFINYFRVCLCILIWNVLVKICFIRQKNLTGRFAKPGLPLLIQVLCSYVHLKISQKIQILFFEIFSVIRLEPTTSRFTIQCTITLSAKHLEKNP